MTRLVRQAALTNDSLCGRALAAHGIASTLTNTQWRAHATPIPFYPGFISLAPNAALPSQIFGGIKDSFNDLSPNGYTLGIAGNWWLAPMVTPARSPPPPRHPCRSHQRP